MRGGTNVNPMCSPYQIKFQSTRPMRGGTDYTNDNIDIEQEISIHPPHAGRDK